MMGSILLTGIRSLVYLIHIPFRRSIHTRLSGVHTMWRENPEEVEQPKSVDDEGGLMFLILIS